MTPKPPPLVACSRCFAGVYPWNTAQGMCPQCAENTINELRRMVQELTKEVEALKEQVYKK